jgi:hypothetical protein|nr:MAG TPA: hypothetical protein [Caudoviricetes sp.]
MPTPFDTIIDLALTLIDDYALINLYNQKQQKFFAVCDSYLIAAIPNFTRCKQSLSYDATLRQFDNELTDLEISILADYWILAWFKKQTQDSKKFNALLQSSGSFKSHSAAQNLKEKNTYLNGLREKVSQKVTDYQAQDIESLSF